jgi:predicted phage-related endonuclease
MPSGGDRCVDIIAKKYPVSNDELPTVDLMAYDKDLARLADVKSEIKALEDEKSKLEQSLKEALGEASKGEYGLYKVSYKTSSSQRIDTKRLKMEMPEVYDRYSSVMASRRFVFTVTK